MSKRLHDILTLDFSTQALTPERDQELNPNSSFYAVPPEAYLSANFGPNKIDFFNLCLHWAFLVHDFNQENFKTKL